MDILTEFKNELTNKIKELCIKTNTNLYKGKYNHYIYITNKGHDKLLKFEDKILDLTKIKLSLKQFDYIYKKIKNENKTYVLLDYNFGLKYEQIFSYLIRIKDTKNLKLYIKNQLKPNYTYITKELFDNEDKMLKQLNKLDKNGEILYEYINKNKEISSVIKNYWEIYTKQHHPQIYEKLNDFFSNSQEENSLIIKNNIENINIKINKNYLNNKYDLNSGLSIQEYISQKSKMIFILKEILKKNDKLEIYDVESYEKENYIEIKIEKNSNNYDKNYINNYIEKIFECFFQNINKDFDQTMIDIVNKYILYDELKLINNNNKKNNKGLNKL